MRAVNLIPTDQRGGGAPGAGQSGGGAYAVLGLLAGLAILAVLYGVAHHQISSRQGEAATASAAAQQATAEATTLAPYTSFVALRESRMQAVSQLVNSRFDWAHAFHEFGRVLPPEVSINSLTGTIGAATASAAPAPAATPGAASAASSSVTSATPSGSVPTFTLSGCAINQPYVALMLERLRLIDGVSEVVLQSSSKASQGAGAGSGTGSCPKGAPAFSAQVNFDALPSVSAASAAEKTTTKTVADSTASAAKPSSPSTGVTAR